MMNNEKKKPTNDLVKMLYGGVVTKADFNYDMLMGPPLLQLMTPQDINVLRTEVSTSVKLAGNAKRKNEIIDLIMHQRNFVRLAGGTNRLVYRHREIQGIVVKVAFDEEGMRSNIDEFKNQRLIKPYCCKVFEVSPCGTVGLFERVDRITSRYEFSTIADNVYDMITHILIGKYVVSDIGTNFMYNWGVRVGFGPVLLDFPYIFRLDGSKIVCKNRLEDGSVCNGEIDYDPGFNFLKCKKCGKPYHAVELSKPNSESGLFVSKKKGEIDMRIAYVKGDVVVNVVDKGETTTSYMKAQKKIVREKHFDPNNIHTVPICVGARGKKTVTTHQPEVKERHTNDYGKFVGKRVETTIPTNQQAPKNIFDRLGIVTETTEEARERDTHHNYTTGAKVINALPVTRMVSSLEDEKRSEDPVVDKEVEEHVSEDMGKVSENMDQSESTVDTPTLPEDPVVEMETISENQSGFIIRAQVPKRKTMEVSSELTSNPVLNISDEMVEAIMEKIDKNCFEGKTQDSMDDTTDSSREDAVAKLEEPSPSPEAVSEEVPKEEHRDYGIYITPADKIRENLEMKADKRSVRFDPVFYNGKKKK